MIEVHEDGFAGSTVVFSSETAIEVAKFLIEHGAYKGPMIMDGGYFITNDGGRSLLFQGPNMDRWIESLLTTAASLAMLHSLKDGGLMKDTVKGGGL